MSEDWTPEHYTLTGLRARGWTDRLIEAHLGPPDRVRPNPFSKRKPPMRLWLIARVEAAEAEHGIRPREKSPVRSAAMKASAQRRADAMMAEIDALDIRVPQMSRGALLRRACAHFNERRRDGEPATPSSDPAFLARIQLNYLRHAMTDYDALLDERAGRVGIRMGGHARLFRRVMDAISARYPHLAQACEQQYLWRFGAQE
ncbi:hypothetical protein [Deinococcus sp. S9]|uniref:hypothetical protein n=1 Tax=Deinococcus sp. S9 TaxID=2545754 RepID=UPI0010569179|nr:hypothetical protein [Deinococcus sp. S9]TDE87401.1 hypothetical protein E0686_02600 [Deinococcus sp. S9]